jgi:hypothetical protein
LELAVTNLLKFFAYFFDERRPGGFFEATISGLVGVFFFCKAVEEN